MKTVTLPKSGQTPDLQAPLELLKLCGGYYESRRDGSTGKRLTPLVGYAGRYGNEKKQFVGDTYANFAMAERHAPILRYFARKLFNDIIDTYGFEAIYATGFCAAPEGGKALGSHLAHIAGSQYIFPEKKVTAVASDSSREKSILVWGRHKPEVAEEWWIVEDVCNNFSTTKDLVALIESAGAKVLGILCFLNRPLDIDTEYTVRDGLILPVISIVRKPIPEYEQEDPEVAADIAAGNVVWKPKNDWHLLVG